MLLKTELGVVSATSKSQQSICAIFSALSLLMCTLSHFLPVIYHSLMQQVFNYTSAEKSICVKI